MYSNDIKDLFSKIKIEDQEYKIAFCNKAYEILEEKLNLGTYEILEKINKGEFKSLKDRILICHAGFLKYHPDLSIETVKNSENISTLWDKVSYEFMRVLMNPAIFDEVKRQADATEKKMLALLSEAPNGAISTLLQQLSSDGAKSNTKKATTKK